MDRYPEPREIRNIFLSIKLCDLEEITGTVWPIFYFERNEEFERISGDGGLDKLWRELHE